MINRREFLRQTYRIGGLAAIYSLGAGAFEEARAWGILPAVVGGEASASGPPVSYASWTETTELVNNSLVWLLESGATENETGVDSRAVPITEVDLILTQSGGVAAASGSPPSRLFDGTDDYMTPTVPATNVVANGTNTWTIIGKVENATDIRTTNNGFAQFGNTAGDYLLMGVESGGGFAFQTFSSAQKLIGTTPVQPSVTGMLHIALWGDGTYTRGGYIEAAAGSGANGQPTKWSDFPVNNRLSFTGTTIWANNIFSVMNTIMFNNWLGGKLTGKLYYFLMSDTCLIDNAS